MCYGQLAPSGRSDGDRYPAGVLVPSNQVLRAVGSRIEFSGSPVDVAVSPDGQTLAVSVGARVLLYSAPGVFQRSLELPAAATYAGLAFSLDGQRLAVSTVSGVSLFWLSSGGRTTISVPGRIPSGLAFDPVRPFLYVAVNASNLVARIDLVREVVSGTVFVGNAPVGVAATPDGRRLFVSNWGGRLARPGDTTASSAGSNIIVDGRGVPSTGAVSAIDLESFAVITNIDVGLHPAGIAASPDGTAIAVANANSDSVSLIDPKSLAVSAGIGLTAFPEGYLGSSPTAVAFSSDSRHLFVACGGNNAIASLVLRNGSFEVDSVAPTDWYPVALALAGQPSGDVLYVANAKGRATRTGNGPFTVGGRVGSVGRIPVGAGISQPSTGKHFRNAATAALNDPFRASRAPQGSPERLTDLGVNHVFFIIKENRTYDQVLGDLGVGNGDPKLAIYGSSITPNHHALASQFVTLDNFYASGVVSADGHQWITQAMTTDYVERSFSAGWPRSYPYSGEDPMAFAPTGFIWDNALRHGRSVRIYGEFTLAAAGYSRSWSDYLADSTLPQMRFSTPSRNTVASTANLFERDYPTFALNVPDQFRARIFLDKFKQYVSQGNLPNLVMIWLPADHTNGVAPNTPTPQAMVADNDLALGSIVDAISHSPYWPTSAIFVTEDDAQDGVDHVDGHRTICLVASPYARRGAVDSTSYNQTSIVRTIEDLLGLPPMNKFDAAALPMRSVFTTTPDFTPYFAARNLVPLTLLNADASTLKSEPRKAALASLKMNFSVPDAAPEQKLNRILWHTAKGWNVKYPKIPHRADCQVDDDDDKPGHK